MATFDDLLQHIGEFDAFQRRIFILMCFISAMFTPIYMGIVFLGFVPDYRCASAGIPELSNKCGWTLQEELNYTVLEANGSTDSFYLSQCYQYDVDWNSTSPSCTNSPLNITSQPPITRCKDGWVYNTTGSSIVTEFNLVCGDSWKLDLIQSCVNLGFFIGGFISGYIADRFGRKPFLMTSLLITAIFGILMAFSPNYPLIVIFRFIQGLVSKGCWLSGYILVAEFVGLEHRRTVGILYQVAFTVGLLLLSGVAYVLPHWRWLQMTVTIPYFLFLAYYWCIPESPRWLITQNRKAEAKVIIHTIAKKNGKTVPDFLESLTADEEVCEKQVPSFLDLVRTPQIRKHTLILMYIWFTCAVVYQGLIMHMGSTGDNIYLDFFISALVEFPSAIIIIFTVDRVGRRWPWLVGCIITGVACLITTFIPHRLSWLIVTLSCVSRMGITLSYEMVCLVNAELYPTFIRNLGIMVCSSLCDLGGVITPFIVYRLADIWQDLPLTVFAVLATVSGILVYFLPETRGRALPETIEEAENLHKQVKTTKLATTYSEVSKVDI
ncbi:solute carrier family 22 (organic cation transporter), member 2 L homeolog [Xenopus laevis]|uniref:MGC82013 protein n=1 Tax=Xenopus laevis TaxID=8355 RepID=Q66J42_XENLA|nr:solute carrier family 22 (organic cation transporter), member 2 L homeolog [Xenopus laevis]AAH81068.1 MGC82013 protein [Xenopus laevis]